MKALPCAHSFVTEFLLHLHNTPREHLLTTLYPVETSCLVHHGNMFVYFMAITQLLLIVNP